MRRLMCYSLMHSGQPALTPPELSRLVCGYALLGDSTGEVAALLDAVAGTVVRRIKVCELTGLRAAAFPGLCSCFHADAKAELKCTADQQTHRRRTAT